MRRFFSGAFRHFWRLYVTVVLCTAVATGVLAGALVVGDSVRGSLRNLTEERLGGIQHALVAERFFEPSLLGRDAAGGAILLNGTVVATQTRSRASRVNVLGVSEAFFGFWEGGAVPTLERAEGSPFPAVVINEPLQRELKVAVGDSVLVNVPQVADIHREFLLGDRDAAAAIQTLRMVVRGVVPSAGAGRFSLQPNQRAPLNAFVALPVLQEALGQAGRVNVVFSADPTPLLPAELRLDMAGLGLKIQEAGEYFDLQSEAYLLNPFLSDVAAGVASVHGIPILPTLTYLANSISSGDRSVPYSTIVALPFSELLGKAGDAGASGSREIVLNTWAAADLGVEVGDAVDITYYRVGAGESYLTESASFVLKDVVEMSGVAADREIIPTFPGIHGTADMSDWESPFPIDYGLIRGEDEAYWDAYGATPKAFIRLAAGQALWRNRFGNLTLIRLGAASGLGLQETRALFETEFLKRVEPERVGFTFLSVRADGLRASGGATDFGALFGSLSAFIIVAVALLVGMLFRIGVEQRSREIGILRAVGYPIAKIRRRFLYEGCILAGIGSLVGCGLAVGYAALMIAGLHTWWLPAIGTRFMTLHVSGWSLLIGAVISLGVVMLSIRMTVHKVGRAGTVSLLAGQTDFSDATGQIKSRWRTLRFWGWLLIGGVGGVVGVWLGQPVVSLMFSAFFVIGAGSAGVDRWLRGRGVSKNLNRVRFAIRNAARQPGRNKTCVMTISIACCIIVAVGANRHDTLPETEYAFVAESALPLHHNLNTADGKFELGFSESASAVLAASEVIPFRVLPGEDVSCLNLYQPRKPQILGASAAMLVDEPWAGLGQTFTETGRVQAIGDENSLRWVLHHDPGDDFLVEDEFGEPLRLKVETVSDSLFQSQLVISESDFTRYFPSRSGYQFFLIKTPEALRTETAEILERTLGEYGFDLTSAAERLAGYRAVENTYISTFQSLGGLGVLLGTFGLALVFFRNIIERRGELATLRAFGFRRRVLSWMLFLESCFLLGAGIVIGCIAGVVAIFASQGQLLSFPWGSLTITLLFIACFGIIANAIAVAVALRSPLLGALKSE